MPAFHDKSRFQGQLPKDESLMKDLAGRGAPPGR